MGAGILLISTPRLFLRVPGTADAARMLAYVEENREHLGPWEPKRTETYFTEAFWKRELATALPEFREGLSLRLVLCPREGPVGSFIGTCNFRNVIRGVFQSCTLGYGLDRRFEGRSLMFEALDSAIRYAFEQMRLHRVMAAHVPENGRSAKLLERLGFEREGYAKDYLMIDGRWRDHVLTARVNRDWKS